MFVWNHDSNVSVNFIVIINNHQHGLSLLETMLVVAVIGIIFLGVMDRLAVWNSTYKQEKNMAQVQETIAELLAAASAQYYQTCKSGVQLKTLSCKDLGLAASHCVNPWQGDLTAPFTVQIVQSDVTEKFYQLKVQGDFSGYLQDKAALAKILNADEYDGSSYFYWTRLPSNSVTNQGVWYRVPGNYLAVTNMNETGGSHFDSGMWIMKAGLAQFKKSQGDTQCPD